MWSKYKYNTHMSVDSFMRWFYILKYLEKLLLFLHRDLYIYLYIWGKSFLKRFTVHFDQFQPVPRLLDSLCLNASAGSAVIMKKFMSVCICASTFTLYIFKCVYLYAYGNGFYSYVNEYLQSYKTMYTHLCVFIYMYVYIYTYIYIHMYICTNTYVSR